MAQTQTKEIAAMGMIGTIPFRVNGTSLKSISEEVDFGWAQSSRVGNYPKLQAVSTGKETFTLSGVLLLQKVSQLDELKKLGQEQKPVSLSLASIGRVNGKEATATIQVVILSLSMQKTNFLVTGEHLEQSFTLNLQRWTP